MSTILEIPLIEGPQRFTVPLSGIVYTITLTYRDVSDAGPMSDQGGWIMEIGDDAGATIVTAIPLVSGVDLLQPYSDLFLPPGTLFVASEPQLDAKPTFESLGVTTHLYYSAPDVADVTTIRTSTGGGVVGGSGGIGSIPVWGA